MVLYVVKQSNLLVDYHENFYDKQEDHQLYYYLLELLLQLNHALMLQFEQENSPIKFYDEDYHVWDYGFQLEQ